MKLAKNAQQVRPVKFLVRGDNVMGGYLNDVEESSLKLKSGWYDTGDLGYMDADGYLYHKGRL